MNRFKYLFIAVLTSALFLLQIWYAAPDGQSPLASSASAYPAPQPIQQQAYPGPRTNNYPTLNTEVDLTDVNLDKDYYLPMVAKLDFPEIGFSVSELNSFQSVRQVVPDKYAIDSYSWDTLPNPNSSIQMIRSCTYYRKYERNDPTHGQVYSDYYDWGDKICWDPISERLVEIVKPATILYEDTTSIACPKYKLISETVRTRLGFRQLEQTIYKKDFYPCLETERINVTVADKTNAEEILIDHIRNNPYDIWLIANEPDNHDQDAFVNTIMIKSISNKVPPSSSNSFMFVNRWDTHRTPHSFKPQTTSYHPLTVGGTAKYANFFAQMYQFIYEAYLNEQPEPKLVFCQATFAHDDRVGQGLNFCRDAYVTLDKIPLFNKENSTFGPDQIYALSTHQYIYKEQQINNQILANGQLLREDDLPQALENWKGYLQEFEAWAISENMGNKPLWLTEYGSLAADCPQLDLNISTFKPDEMGCRGLGRFTDVEDPNFKDDNVTYTRIRSEAVSSLKTGASHTLYFHVTYPNKELKLENFKNMSLIVGSDVWNCEVISQCSIELKVSENDQHSNATIDLTIHNRFGEELKNWYVRWSFDGGEEIARSHVFYGRNNREGVWGLQKGQIEYLAGNNQWKGAWWFISLMGHNPQGFCEQTAWLWRNNFNCKNINTNFESGLNYAGVTHWIILKCLETGLSSDCNATPDTVTTLPQITKHGMNIGQPYCKSLRRYCD